MAVNLPNNPANGDSVLLNGTTYVYNSTNNSWDIPVVTEAILPLTSLSVGPEATPSGDGAISYDNTTGIFTYTPPVISGGSGITAYANTTDLPTSEVTTGAMAYVSANNKLYIWNGTAWFNIAIVNQAPTAITGNLATYILATDGTPTVVTLVSTDPEGLPLTWSSSTSGDTQVGTVTNTDNVFTITPSTNEANIGTLSVTFSVTDGNNTETSISSFTLEFVSAYWNETVLSIGTSSTNGLANSTFIDRSTNAHTVTPAGTPVQTAFHPYLENWGVEFDGSGDYLSTSVSSTFQNSSFTVEGWFYPLVDMTTGTHSLFNLGSATSTTTRMTVGINAGTWFCQVENSNVNQKTVISGDLGGYSLNRNVWTHFAISFNYDASYGNSIGYIFVNGVLAETFSLVGFPNTTTVVLSNSNIAAAQRYFTGYISNFRTVQGTALYTTNFTPPTEKLTAVTGTSLLTCQSNRFVDNSSNAHTITLAGNVEISAFNPFGQESEYAVGENKGSTYFDGVNDYLRATDTSLAEGTDDFTLECWFYLPRSYTPALNDTLFGHDTTPGYQICWSTSGFAFMENASSDSRLLNTNTVTTDIFASWHHIAYTRESGILYGFIDGQLIGSETLTTNFTDTTIDVGVNRGGTEYINAYISDLRIVKGTALYTSNFTPPTAPVGNTNASLYLPFDNAGIFDKTGNNTFTPVGNASTSTTQTKYADTAMYFDGTGDYLSGIINRNIVFGTEDMTIECWVYPNSLSGTLTIFDTRQGGTNYGTDSFSFSINNGIPVMNAGSYSTTTAIVQAPSTINLSTWVHIASTRENGTNRLFIDGVSVDSNTRSWNQTFTDGRAYYIGQTVGFNRPFNGYIENFQILKGVAKYTANFTPPNRTQGREYQEES